LNNLEEKSLVYDFGEFRLDAAERVLFKNGAPVNLPPKVFDTLLVLVEKSGHIVERETLMGEVWKDTFVEEANLSVNISALRKTLGKNAQGDDFIETIARRGYRFRNEILKISDDFSGAEDEMMIVHRRLQARIIKTEIENESGSGVENQRSLAAMNVPIKSLAILPFHLIKVEKGDEYLSLSLADALITQLGNTSKIVVRPTSAVKPFAGQNSLDAGRELQVDAVLECSIYRTETKLRVTAIMLKTETGISFWSDKFDVEFKDIFVVQDTIAEQVARALTLKLNEQERAALTKRYTTSNEAFREYLKGRYFWNKRDVENFHKAIAHFKKAIDLDPTYALAYSGLADTYNMLPMWGEMSPREGYVLAKAAALKALEIDDQIADAHASLGYTKYLFDWDFESAETSYRRAIELNPNCGIARNWYAKLFVSLKRFDEAHEQMSFAYEIDPLSPMVAASVIAVYLYSRRYDEAVEKYEKLLETTPNFVPALIGLGIAYSQKGMAREALAAHQLAVDSSANNLVLIGVFAVTQAVFGNKEFALKTVEKLKQNYSQFTILSYVIAMIYVQLGKIEESFEWLEKAHQERISHLADLLIDPEFDSLRNHPRFDDLLKCIGLSHIK
jgi:DNA-binding winged helix-turn-helix (wHTH) protein/tetratricopeptide (TPR) repeat protein